MDAVLGENVISIHCHFVSQMYIPFSHAHISCCSQYLSHFHSLLLWSLALRVLSVQGNVWLYQLEGKGPTYTSDAGNGRTLHSRSGAFLR